MLINAGLRRKKIVFVISIFSKTPFFWLLQYTPRHCFESFVQNALVDRGEGDQNSRSTVVGETMNLNENKLVYLVIIYCSRDTNTKYKKSSYVDIFLKFGFIFNSINNSGKLFLSYCTPNIQCCNLKAIFPPLSVIPTNMR